MKPAEDKTKTPTHDVQECHRQSQQQEENKQEKQDINNNNNIISPNNSDSYDSESTKVQEHIIPWRAQLRKTNSKLNLLD